MCIRSTHKPQPQPSDPYPQTQYDKLLMYGQLLLVNKIHYIYLHMRSGLSEERGYLNFSTHPSKLRISETRQLSPHEVGEDKKTLSTRSNTRC